MNLQIHPRLSNILFLSLVLGLTAPSCSRNKDKSRIGKVTRKDLSQRITVSGVVTSNMKSEIQASYAGYIRKIFVKLGQNVKKNDPLVLITQTLDSGGEQFPIRAPFDGVVVQINRAEGEYVEVGAAAGIAGRPIVRVDDITRLFISADVPEVDFPKIKIGQEVNIRVSPILDQTYLGTVREMALAANEDKSGYRYNEKIEFNVRIEITNKDQAIKPGMSAMVDIIPEKRVGTLTLGHEYVYENENKHYVILENGNRVDLKIGLQNEDDIEILEGLKEGDTVRQVDFLEIPSHN